MKHNKAFDFLKVFFILVVVIHHSGLLWEVLTRGYIGVEFFFITSGYFLYQTYVKDPSVTTGAYMKKRLLKLYPAYLAAYLFTLVVYLVKSQDFSAYVGPYSPLLEITMLQNVGFPGGGINYPLWYLSVLMLSSLIIYGLLRVLSPKVFRWIALIVIFSAYGYLICTGPGIERWGRAFGIIYEPLWRGAADVFLGVLLCQLKEKVLAQQVSAENEERQRSVSGRLLEICRNMVVHKRVLHTLEIVSFVGVVVLMIIPGTFDYLSVLLIILLVFAISMPESLLQRAGSSRFTAFLMPYEYAIFLNHAALIVLARGIYEPLQLPRMLCITVLYLMVICFSVLFTKGVSWTMRRILKSE